MLLISFCILAVVALSCQIENNERFYYLNEGEYFLLYLEQVFKEENQTYVCKGCPENIQLKNTINPIGQKQINKHVFESLSSNQTHFLFLTNDQNLIIFENKQDDLEIVEIIKLDKKMNCLNAIFSLQGSILVDCYDDTSLYINQIANGNTLNLYNVTLKEPKSSEIQQYIDSNEIYTLFAQYYEDYSILTLFSEQQKTFVNETTWTYGLNNFIASNGVSNQNFIYILVNSSIIFQVSINDQIQFEVEKFWYEDMKIYAFQVFRSLKFFSQCDQLIIFVDQKPEFIHYQACKGNFIIYQSQDLNFHIDNYTYYNIFTNEDFFILQQNQSLSISSSQIPKFIYFQQEKKFDFINKLNTLYYFNPITNQIFEFSQLIQKFQISYPQLSGYYSNQNESLIIRIYGIDQFLYEKDACAIILNFFPVQSNDTSVYVSYQYKSLNQYVILNTSFYDQIEGYVGPLTYYEGNIDQEVGSFNNQTQRQSLIQLQSDYDLAQIFYISALPKSKCLFITGVKEYTINFQFCCLHLQCDTYEIQLNNSNEVQQIQTVYSLEGVLIVTLTNEKDKINIFLVEVAATSIMDAKQQQLNVTQFFQYVLSFNCIILLNNMQGIEIISFDGSIVSYLNETNFQTFFPLLQVFNPQGIFLNSQYLSSVLIINNQQTILLLRITEQLVLLPLNFIKSDDEILWLSLVMNYIILAHKCDNNRAQACFDVWNISNPEQPNFFKKFRSLLIDEIITTFADNLFFYIQTKDQLLVYNPLLSQHQSPWKSIQYDNSYFTSTYVKGFSYILCKSSFTELFPITLMQFIPSETYVQQIYLASYNYNFTIYSELNSSTQQQTKNLSINIINSYTNIFLQDLKIPVSQRQFFSISEGQINVNSQVFNYSLLNLNSNKTNEECACSLQNPIIQNSTISYNHTYKIVVVVDNLYILQNEKQARVVGGMVLFYEHQYPYCYLSTTEYDHFYTVCSNYKITYLLSFKVITKSKIIQKTTLKIPIIFDSLTQLKASLSLFFLLGNSFPNLKNVYLFNSNLPWNSEYITDCDNCNYFAVTNFQNTTNYALIALFYSCQNKILYKVGKFDLITKIAYFDTESQKLQLETVFKQKYDYPIEIQILKVIDFEIVALITTTDFCSTIVSMIYSSFKKQFFVQHFMTTIPPIGNFILFNSKFDNGIITLTYGQVNNSQQYNFIYAFYQISNYQQYNIEQPMQMIGALQFDIAQLIAVMSNSFGNYAQVLIFRNNSGTIYNLSKFQINCKTQISLFSKDKTYTYKLIGQNYLYENFSILTITYERGPEIYFYILGILAFLCFFGCFVYFQQKNYEQLDSYSIIFKDFEL